MSTPKLVEPNLNLHPPPVAPPPGPAVSPAPRSPRARLRLTLQQKVEQGFYVGLDLVGILASAIFAVLLFYPTEGAALLQKPEYRGWLLTYMLLTVMSLEWNRLYRRTSMHSAIDEAFAVGRAVFVATLLAICFLYVTHNSDLSRRVLLLSGVGNLVTLNVWRLARRRFFARRLADGHGVRNALILGNELEGVDLARYLTGKKDLGFAVKSCLYEHLPGPKLFSEWSREITRLIRSEYIDVVFAVSIPDRAFIRNLHELGRQHRVDVYVVPEFYKELSWLPTLGYVGEMPVIQLHREDTPQLELALKRLLDVFIAVTALLITLPLTTAIALAIKLGSSGPIFYQASRVGRRGKIFKCLKFRTMYQDADARLPELRHLNEREGVWFKMTNDPRITPLGRILRKYSLDEIPQFLNVLAGEMSVVGPRPAEVCEFDQYQLEHRRRLEAVPGITGLWQVTARSDPSFENYMALDLAYIENWSLWLDLKILLRTVPVVISGNGK